METHQAGAVVFCAKAIFHQAVPDLARGAVFGDLFEEIVMRIEKEAEAWSEIVNVKAATARPLDIFDTVVNGECEFLQSGGSGFANVVAADGDGVEARSELRSEFEGVDH